MNTKAIVPLFTSNKIAETRDFYTNYLGFEVIRESDEYLGLRLPNDGLEIGFMPSCDEMPEASGTGLWYCFSVDDIEAEYQVLLGKSAPVTGPPENMPWGDRRICLVDPNGITVYVAKCAAAMDTAGEMG